MVRIEQLGLDGETWIELESIAAELGGSYTAEEVALVVFAPEAAPLVGLNLLLATLTNMLADRVNKLQQQFTDYAKREVKKYVTNHFREKRYKKRSNRNDNNQDDPPDEGNPPPEEPDNPADVKPIMSKSTSFPTSLMCVDLGTMSLPTKGGKRGDYLDEDDVIGHWHEFSFEVSKVVACDQGKNLTHPLGEMDLNSPAVVGLNSIASTFRTTATSIVSFNSVQILDHIRPFVSGIVGTGPEFVSGAIENTIAEFNRSQQVIGIKNQYLDLHFKNITTAKVNTVANATLVVPATTGQASNITLDDPAPCKCTLYAMQAKENLHQSDGQVEVGYLRNYVAAGYTMDMASNGPIADTPALPNSCEQNYYVSIGKNTWLMDKWKIVQKKDFCLCPGQEGHMRIYMPQTQILSYAYEKDVKYVSNTLRCPVVVKKGEIQFFIRIHGGMNAVGTLDTTTATLSGLYPAKVGIAWYSNLNWEACLINTREPHKHYRQDRAPNNADPPLDADTEHLE